MRFNYDLHTPRCFVCDLDTSESTGRMTVVDSRSRHSRNAHPHCWATLLRYAQVVVDTQVAGQAVPCL
jgi:hypothetical protein